MRVCFLTFDNPGTYVIDDDLAIAPLRALGIDVVALPWRETNVDWRAFDAAIIRSTWDYHHQPDRFLSVLATIEACGTAVHNPRHIVAWNLTKTYLRDLAERGVAVVPTIWRDALGHGELEPLFDRIGAPEIVVKPVVGANADGAFRLDARAVARRGGEIEGLYATRALMAQPFLESIERDGEYSLFYFNGAFSHAIVKRPKGGDFRVQEEHGGDIQPVQPERALREAGQRAIDAIGEILLYARADFVRDAREGYLLMELELIEPSLYLRMDEHAPARFAGAVQAIFLQNAN